MTTVFRAQWVGFRAPSGQFTQRVPQELRRTLAATAGGLQARLRHEAPRRDPANAPPGTRPGQLRAGLTVEERVTATGGTLDVRSAAPYTGYVRRGHGPIRARPGKRLRFWYRGRWVFARRVRGVPANDFVARAVTAYQPQLRAELSTLVGRLRAALFAR